MRALQEDLAALQSERGRRAPARRRRAPLTLRTHGFNSRLSDFARDLVREAAAPEDESLRPGGRVLVGYRWPSEGLLSARSLGDTWRALVFTVAVSVVLLLLPALALLPPGHRWLAGGATGPVAAALRPLFWPYASTLLASALLGAGLLLLLFRLSTYLRDRYRALHYGAPDLCEFVRDLELGLDAMRVRVALDIVGHSLGCLMLVNAVRVMSDFFHLPGAEPRTLGTGRALALRTLVLCGPDIPAALATPQRNNYFLSALRRFSSVHVLSSDRDIVLKWASTLMNWSSEPTHDMAGRHLGNVLLARADSVPPALRPARATGGYLPALRPQVRSFAAVGVAAAGHAGGPAPGAAVPRPVLRGRLAWIHFHDCSACPSLGGGGRAPVLWSLAALALCAALHLALRVPFTAWLLGWAAILFGLGALLRGVEGWRDHWRLGPWIGALADWPAVVSFGRRVNPHGGYLVPGSEPRRLVAHLLAHPAKRLAAGETPALPAGADRLRSCAVALEV